jgi:RNA polymerase sigma-70 factor, ECF subfamily
MTVGEQTSAGPVFSSIGRAEYDRLVRELTGYCYRMLGSPFDAEDAVQDTMLRAWRQQDRFEGRSSVRTWLHAIATNVCLDMLRSRSRRSIPMDLEPPSAGDGSGLRAPLEESRWVLPIPDARLPGGADPAQQVESKETVRLAFAAALQRLTPRQRAALILRDVLKFSAAESAQLLGTSVASANSALQRARGALPADGGAGAPEAGGGSGAGAALLEEFISAFEAYDIRRLTALLRSDAVQSMPPLQMWLSGAAEIERFMTGPGAECRGSRVLPSAANGGLAYAQYRSDGRGGHAPWALGLLETDGRQITAMHTFLMPELFGLFGFPAAL